jgi:hypothetical protein
MTINDRDLSKIAEDYITTGAWDAEAVDRLDDEALDELLDHLVSRAAVEAAAATIESESVELDDEAQAAVLNLQSFYLGQVARARAAKIDPAAALLKPATWRGIEPVLRDRDFLVRLAERRLRGLGSRCMRDLADLLGFPRKVLEDFFAGAPSGGLALAEHRNAGKPQDGGSEEFSVALARSAVPDAFKRRWGKGSSVGRV